jgi:hypothetical protein
MSVICFLNKYQHRITAVNYVHVRIATKPRDIKLHQNVGTILFKTEAQIRPKACNIRDAVSWIGSKSECIVNVIRFLIRIFNYLFVKDSGYIGLKFSNDVVRFHVLTAASIKMAVFWDVAPNSLVEVCRRFRGAYYLNRKESP